VPGPHDRIPGWALSDNPKPPLRPYPHPWRRSQTLAPPPLCSAASPPSAPPWTRCSTAPRPARAPASASPHHPGAHAPFTRDPSLFFGLNFPRRSPQVSTTTTQLLAAGGPRALLTHAAPPQEPPEVIQGAQHSGVLLCRPSPRIPTASTARPSSTSTLHRSTGHHKPSVSNASAPSTCCARPRSVRATVTPGALHAGELRCTEPPVPWREPLQPPQTRANRPGGLRVPRASSRARPHSKGSSDGRDRPTPARRRRGDRTPVTTPPLRAPVGRAVDQSRQIAIQRS
jgi:hypothetical protein